MSLAVVLTALPARLVAVPYQWGQLAPSRRQLGLTEPLGFVDPDHGVVMTVL
jgi:hypothetical protein